jgi:hypothetical protein
MSPKERAETRDPFADEVTPHGAGDCAGPSLVNRVACLAILMIVVAEEKGIMDVVRLFVLA